MESSLSAQHETFQPFLRFYSPACFSNTVPRNRSFQPFLRFYISDVVLASISYSFRFQPFLRFYMLTARRTRSAE